MAVTVLLELKAKSGTGAGLVGVFKQILPDTRKFDGNIGVTVFQDQDDSDTVLLIEEWESRPAYEKYLAWRTETGALDQLAAALDSPPSIRYFDATDA
jgi:quinol monooxygenase YgiN